MGHSLFKCTQGFSIRQQPRPKELIWVLPLSRLCSGITPAQMQVNNLLSLQRTTRTWAANRNLLKSATNKPFRIDFSRFPSFSPSSGPCAA